MSHGRKRVQMRSSVLCISQCFNVLKFSQKIPSHPGRKPEAASNHINFLFFVPGQWNHYVRDSNIICVCVNNHKFTTHNTFVSLDQQTHFKKGLETLIERSFSKVRRKVEIFLLLFESSYPGLFGLGQGSLM